MRNLQSASPPRVLIVSGCPGSTTLQRDGLDVNGLPDKLALRELLIDLRDGAAARGKAAPLAIDTLHIPSCAEEYGAQLLDQTDFPYRYDVAISHIVLDNGARVTAPFFEALTHRALKPHGQLVNPVACIRKTTLHALSGAAAFPADPMPCIVKLDRNYNREGTVSLCHNQAALDAWRRDTPAAEQEEFVREPFYVDSTHRDGGVYRLERWMVAFDSLTVECRFSDSFFVKASTSFRYQLRDRRCLEEDWRLLGTLGWNWRGQSVDCAYDEDADAWDVRYRVMKAVTAAFNLHWGEIDVIRTARNEFTVIDVTHTPGVLVGSRYCLLLTQAILVQHVREIARQA